MYEGIKVAIGLNKITKNIYHYGYMKLRYSGSPLEMKPSGTHIL